MKIFFLFFYVSWHSGTQIHGPYTKDQCETIKENVIAIHEMKSLNREIIYCKAIPEEADTFPADGEQRYNLE
ncbi:MAG: hypothetical protein J6N20_20395 [Pseudomonas sp.]|nr:hypothetical protein [Pseudomonas sp.]